MNKEILDRFMQAISTGAPVWYRVDDTLGGRWCVYEPTAEKPWQWVGNQTIADKLLLRAPQAVQIWEIPDSVNFREKLQKMELAR